VDERGDEEAAAEKVRDVLPEGSAIPDKWPRLLGARRSSGSYRGERARGIRVRMEAAHSPRRSASPWTATTGACRRPRSTPTTTRRRTRSCSRPGSSTPPFFYRRGGRRHQYGAIGGVIGHEIIHGFDNSGRKYDAKGNQVGLVDGRGR
jgi:hypothetical protein